MKSRRTIATLAIGTIVSLVCLQVAVPSVASAAPSAAAPSPAPTSSPAQPEPNVKTDDTPPSRAKVRGVHAKRHAEAPLQHAGSTNRDLRTLPAVRPTRMERPEQPAPVNPNWASFPADSPAANVRIPASAAPAPAPTSSFDGLDFNTWGAGHPPDTNGDVGPTVYIQTVNSSIGIYQKSTGSQLAAFTFNTFMSQGTFGNLCDTNNFGDPVVLYDSFEDRWVLSDFAFKLTAGAVDNPPGAFECIAVSKTGDPVGGGWNFYSVNTAGGLGDYPKLGIWPDGIYMSVNMFGYPSGGAFQGARVYAFNKAQMYAGAATAQNIAFDAPTSDFSLLPSNARLQTGTPPPGTPNYFLSTWQFTNSLTVYKFHVDWTHPLLSTFTGPDTPLAATSWPNASVANAPSLGGNNLDVLQIRAMAQNQYSNIGGVESLWATHTVNRATLGVAAPRYYQVNVTGGTVNANLPQAATWDPDGNNNTYRFMPSVAVDRAGDLAMGYSVSSATTKPAIKYAGRLASDPINTFSQSEQTLVQGTGTQTGSCGGTCLRWGDYSAMTLDPDGCTFWYTNEYYAVDGLNDLTKIGSFSYPSCTPVGSAGTLSGTVKSGSTPLSGATVRLGSRSTTSAADGTYSFAGLPAGTYPSVAATVDGYQPTTVSSVAVAAASTTTQDLNLAPAPTSGNFVDTTQSDFLSGTTSSTDGLTSSGQVLLTGGSFLDQQQTTLSNSGVGITITTWGGQTFTPATTGKLTKADINLFCSGCTGTAPNLTLSVRATSGNAPTGADLASTTLTGNGSGSSSYFTGTFGSPATLTSGTTYALVVRPVANPSVGIYALTRSATNVYAGGQRVSSADSGGTWTAPLTAGQTTDAGFRTYMDAGYLAAGTFTSSVKDANPLSGNAVSWGNLSWTAGTPASTAVTMQAAASTNPNGPFSFVGPDGTAGTTFTSPASLSQFDGKRYLQYRASLTTSDPAVSPTLDDVTVGFGVLLPQTITFTGAPVSAAYGTSFPVTATASSGLPVTVTSGGSCSNVGTTITMTSGIGTCSLTGTQAGDGTYQAAPDATQSTTADKASQTVSLTVPSSAVYGDSPFTVSGTATSGLPVVLGATGPCTYSSGQVTITDVGDCVVSGDQAGDNNYAAAPTNTGTVSIGKRGQTITFAPLPDVALGTSPFTVGATSSVGLPVSFVAAGICTVSGGTTVTITGAGLCTITASQPGDTQTNAAADVPQSFTVTQGTATMTLSGQSQTYDGTSRVITVTTGPNGLSGVVVTYDGSTTPPTDAGTYAVHVTLTNPDYTATPVDDTLVVAKATQIITFAALADRDFGTAPFGLSATADSGLPVGYAVGASDNCTVATATVTLTGAGSCTATASQPGDANYLAATDVPRAFTIGKGTATLAFANLAQAYDGTARVVTVTTTPIGLSGIAVTYNGSPTAPTNADSYPVHATLTNADWTAAPVDDTLVVSPATQSITFPPLPNRTVGDPDFVVAATATSGLPVSFAVGGTDQCTIVSATVHLTGAGSCTVTASQAGDSNHAAATAVPNAFAINAGGGGGGGGGGAATATLTLTDLTTVYDGTPKSVTVTTDPPGLTTVTTTYDGSTTAPTAAGSYAVQTTLSNATYTAAPVSGTFVIQKASQVITFAQPADMAVGDPDRTLTATSTSGLPVQFTASGPCTVNGTSLHATGGGSCSITASQPGNGNVDPATAATRTLSIAQGRTAVRLSVVPSRVQYSDLVTLKATVTALGGLALPPGVVHFFLAGTEVGHAVPGSGGVAVASVPAMTALGRVPVRADFVSQDSTVVGSSASSTLTVVAEDIFASLTRSPYAQTPRSSPTSVLTTLSVMVSNAYGPRGSATNDGHPGEARFATVTLIDRATGAAFPNCRNLTVVRRPSSPNVGDATCRTTLRASTAKGASQYEIGIVVGGRFSRARALDDGLIDVAQPIVTGLVTGGGALTLTNSAGPYAGTPSSLAWAAFGVRYNAARTVRSGTGSVLWQRGGQEFLITASSFSRIAGSNGRMTLTAPARLMRVTSPTRPVTLATGLTLVITTLHVAHGASYLGIELRDASGRLLFSSHLTRGVTVLQHLNSGVVRGG